MKHKKRILGIVLAAMITVSGCDNILFGGKAKAGCDYDIVDEWYKTDIGADNERRVEFTDGGEYVKYADLLGIAYRDYYEYKPSTCTLAIITFISKTRTEYDVTWSNSNNFCATNVACFRRK